MAGMEVLGRNVQLIAVASGQPFKVREASSVLVVVAGTTSTPVTLTNQPGFAGTPVALAAIKNIYWATANNGTVAWNKLTYVNGVAPFGSGPLSGYTHGTTVGLTTATLTAFHIFTSELTDPNNYLTVTATTGLVSCTVILSDLVHQRGPANLPILAA